MAYKKIKSHKMIEDELRQLWHETYCDKSQPIYTFDNVLVKFYDDMFDHAFFESEDRKKGDKSIFSLNRCEKMLWIKDALQDPDAIIKQGWNKSEKTYSDNRRVTLVKGNYMVIIRFIKVNIAKFVTAYQNDNDNNLQKVLDSPDWEGSDKWIKK